MVKKVVPRLRELTHDTESRNLGPNFLIINVSAIDVLSSLRYMNRPVMSGPGLYDPTSIMNADTLNKCQREGWIKLAFYLLSFFYYLYG